MHYDFVAIPDAEVPRAVDPTFQHIIQTYASEANKTVSMWLAVPDDLLALEAAAVGSEDEGCIDIRCNIDSGSFCEAALENL